MKMRIIVSAIILLLLLLANGSAASDNWSWAFMASSDTQDSSTGGLMGVDPLSDDGYDAADRLISYGPKAYFAVYHGDNEPGWEGRTGFYRYDLRKPVSMLAGSSISWQAHVWADPSLTEEARSIYINYWPVETAPSQLDVWLTLISKPTGIKDGPGVGSRWHISGTSQPTIILPVFRTANGLDGYAFDLTATVVPEPSALAAICVGLAGLVIKRMRR